MTVQFSGVVGHSQVQPRPGERSPEGGGEEAVLSVLAGSDRVVAACQVRSPMISVSNGISGSLYVKPLYLLCDI